MMLATLISLFALLTGDAAEMDAASQLYAEGRWDEAAALSSEFDTADAQILAAGAHLAALMTEAVTTRRDRRRAAVAAREAGERAVELAPDRALSHLRFAAGIGYQTRYISPVGAVLRGLPQRGREHIEVALELDPHDPWGHAMLGAWHMEVARRGGPGTLGADPQFGIERYRAASAMGGTEPALHYYFAVSLIAADPVLHAEEAASELDAALAALPRDAFEQGIQTLSEAMKARLETDPASASEEAIRQLEN
ncbi:MAG: hypothetical protein AAFX09_11050 [Pseudomonadota bacterium]